MLESSHLLANPQLVLEYFYAKKILYFRYVNSFIKYKYRNAIAYNLERKNYIEIKY